MGRPYRARRGGVSQPCGHPDARDTSATDDARGDIRQLSVTLRSLELTKPSSVLSQQYTPTAATNATTSHPTSNTDLQYRPSRAGNAGCMPVQSSVQYIDPRSRCRSCTALNIPACHTKPNPPRAGPGRARAAASCGRRTADTCRTALHRPPPDGTAWCNPVPCRRADQRY